MDYYITSDLHFGHTNILKYCSNTRPFSSIEEMNQNIIDNWNNKVSDQDVVYLLGDVSFDKPSKTINILNSLNGRIRLVVGNHDGDKYLKEKEFCDRFEWIKIYNEEKIFGQHIVMMHFPILEWNKKYHNSIMLHGHCHSKNKPILECLRYDVGIDGSSDFAPYNFSKLIDEIKLRRKPK